MRGGGELGGFTYAAREAEGVLHLRFAGDLDYIAVAELRDSLQEPLAGRRTVVLDLGNVSFVDSAGLRLLVRTKRYVESHGGRLLINELSPAVQHMLALVQLSEWFERVDRHPR